jgi:cytochrome c
MKVLLPVVLMLAACHSSGESTSAAAANPGELLFQQRCALCHSTGTRNGQGPGLAGVVGRPAASAPGFQYTKALRESGLTWDEATLDKFLASPFTLVRGTMMSVATPDAGERKQLIDYLATLAR